MKRIAVITGASSGMGRDLAELIAARSRTPMEFWLIARRRERMEELAKKLAKSGHGARIFAGDLCEDALFDMLSAALDEEPRRILFLVNASGFGKIGEVGELSADVQADMIGVNCAALVKLTRLCLPYMVDGDGRIINFASAAAFLPQPEFAVYAATKAFVLSFSEALCEELKPRGICVTAVCPGPVKTEFFGLAETEHSLALYKRMFMAKPRRVVRKAFCDSLRGKTLSVYGLSMKLLRIGARCLPHSLFFEAMRRIH